MAWRFYRGERAIFFVALYTEMNYATFEHVYCARIQNIHAHIIISSSIILCVSLLSYSCIHFLILCFYWVSENCKIHLVSEGKLYSNYSNWRIKQKRMSCLLMCLIKFVVFFVCVTSWTHTSVRTHTRKKAEAKWMNAERQRL